MHRPETWGYVQFSTGRPGSMSFEPDASLAARRWLHQVYYGLFQASVELRLPGRTAQRWNIRQDALVWPE